MLTRPPIRLRVTLVFALVMALVIGATGVFVYLRFAAELDATINSGLRSRATDVAALVKEADSGLSERRGTLVGRSESFAEVLDAKRRVLDSTASIGGHVLLTRSELRRAGSGPVFLNRGPLPGLQDESRLLAIPVQAHGRRRVVVVGTSTASRTESLADLSQLLLVGGPVALLLASLGAYGVAGATLRPVREALEHERAFVADASHELRTPLAILKAELELALKRGRSPEELRAALGSAAEETDRLTQLAEDLLTIAQTDRGELPVRLERIEVAEILDGVARRFARRTEDSGRALKTSSEPGLVVAADRLRLEQAVGNLLDNALRYGSGPVALAAVSRNGSVELHVRDRGPGFSEDFRGRAFERFSRADASHRHDGSGLGLAIVETIARAHRGEAHVANRDGGGADAWLALPAFRE